LRHEHGETFASAAGFDEFGHRQLVTAVAALFQFRYEVWRSLGQNDVFLNYHSVTRKVRSLFRFDIDQIGDVLTDRALAVLIKGIWKPERTAIG